MMKIKSHKLHKGSRGSPMRKDVLKKPLHSSGSPRLHSPRPPPMKHLSPGMKRSPIMPPGKSVHPPRMRSIASPPQRSIPRHNMQGSPMSMDRIRSIKRPKYEKRKMSPSPIRRDIPSTSRGMRSPSPYQDERYLNPRSSAHGSNFSPPPMKKKSRREPDRYDRAESPNMIMQRPDMPMHSESRMPHRSDMPLHSSPMSSASHRGHVASAVHDDRRNHYEMESRGREGPPPLPSSHSKRPPPVKSPYDIQHSERYRSPSPPSDNRYPPGGEKRYAPTLHERFSAVVDRHRTEPKIKYSREDLEKITIDIHRNLKAQSPTLRRIVDPNDVKLVRRANEGHRPMFDREEIKQAPRDMREDAYYEKKTTSGGVYNSSHSTDLRDVENYEITRHRFDPHHPSFHAASGRSLSDRWQSSEARKESTTLDRDDRDYDRQPTKRNFVDARQSKSGDMDFRSERYPAGEASRSRSDYPDNHHRAHSPDIVPRSLPVHRKEGPLPDARKKLNLRRDSDREPPSGHPDGRSRYMPVSEKRYSDHLGRVEKHHIDHRSSMEPPPHKWATKRRSPMKEEKLPEFSRRPDKYAYKSWPEPSSGPPRSSNYYEGGHEGGESFRGRGGSRPFRGTRGLRSRGRGNFAPRSSYRGGYRNSSTLRGRGGSKRGRFSPGLWEHDMYSRSSEDRKMDLP